MPPPPPLPQGAPVPEIVPDELTSRHCVEPEIPLNVKPVNVGLAAVPNPISARAAGVLASVNVDAIVVASPLKFAPAVVNPFAVIVVAANVPILELTVASVSAPPKARLASPLIVAGPTVELGEPWGS